jgi:hypothetical protein
VTNPEPRRLVTVAVRLLEVDRTWSMKMWWHRELPIAHIISG